MQRYRFQLIAIFCALLLSSCEGTTFKSSVPVYPVRVKINMDLGPFVHLQNKSQGDHIEVTQEGFIYNDQMVLPLGDNMCGYGGVEIYVSVNGFDAYDLACPYCASHGKRQACSIDGMYAICPECGEQYDLASGTAMPQKGLIRETLKRLKLIHSGNTLTITQ